MTANSVSTAPTAHASGFDRRALVRFALSFSLVRFLAVGSAGFALDAGLFAVLAHEGAAEPVARAVSIGAATLLTWRLNRRFTFGDSARHAAVEGGCYSAVALAATGVNFLTFLALRSQMPALHALGAIFVGAVLAAAVSYLGQRFVTFRGSVRR